MFSLAEFFLRKKRGKSEGREGKGRGGILFEF